MATTELEKQRAERLLAQGVPAKVVANTIKNSRLEAAPATPKQASFGSRFLGNLVNNPFVDGMAAPFKAIGGAIEGFAEGSVSGGDRLTDIRRDTTAAGEQGLGSKLLQGTGAVIEPAIGALGGAFGGLMSSANEAIFEGKADEYIVDKVQEFAATPNGQEVVAKGQDLVGGYMEWAKENPEKAQNVEAVAKIADLGLEFVGGKVVKKGLSETVDVLTDIKKVLPEKPKRLKDVFGKKKTVEPVVAKVDDIVTKADDAIVATEETAVKAIDGVLADPKTGITKENQPLISKFFDTENDILTVAEKKTLSEIEPGVFKKYDDVLAKTEIDAKAPKLVEVGMDDVKKAFNDYKAVVRESGSEIGKIKKRLTKQALKEDGQIDDVIKKFTKQMEDNNVLIDGRDVVVAGNSALTGAEKMISDIGEILSNIKSSKSMNELLQGMKQLDNNIIYGRGDDVSQSIQGVAKTLRKDLKNIRDSYLSADELSSFGKYSDTIDFVSDFEKGNMENKISVLLNSAGTARGYKLGDFAKEIKRVTGTDIQDIGLLINTIQRRLPSDNSNLTRFAQLVGTGVPLSTFGLASAAGTVSKNLLRKVAGTDIMTEIRKAGMADVVTNAITNNILPK